MQFSYHPSICFYYKDAFYYEDDSESTLRNNDFVLISDCNGYDTVAVHLFQKFLIDFLYKKFSVIQMITYLSDSCVENTRIEKNF